MNRLRKEVEGGSLLERRLGQGGKEEYRCWELEFKVGERNRLNSPSERWK